MSRLQEAVDRFAAAWLAEHGEKPSQDALLDGTFCVQAQPFCLCLKLGTGLGAMINFTGLTCAKSGKPVTAESYEWMDEARKERAAAAQRGASVGNGNGPPGKTICGTVLAPDHWWRLV